MEQLYIHLNKMANDNRTLIIAADPKNYGSYQIFAALLARQLENQKENYMLLESYSGQDIMKAKNYKPTNVIGFNSNLPLMKINDVWGPEFFEAPFENFLLDHPLYHHKKLVGDFVQRVHCVDKDHVDYVKRYYPNIKEVIQSPMPPFKGTGAAVEYDSKKNRIIFCGTFDDPDRFLEVINDLPHDLKNISLALIEEMTKRMEMADSDFNYTKAYEEIFLEKLQESPLAKDKDCRSKIPEYMHQCFAAEAYLRFKKRNEVMARLIEENFPMDVYTDSTIFKESGKVRIKPAITYFEYLNKCGRYKYNLHIDTGFELGVHDRELNAAINGSTLINARMYMSADEIVELVKEKMKI